jgi:hypothetical protein
MGTSNSNDRWSASAALFSGREDPVWTVAPAQAYRLAEMWERLEDAPEGREMTTGRLGYRGCALRAPDGREWRAYRGVVAAESPDGPQLRLDPQGAFERGLLATAPAGTLPLALLDAAGHDSQ